jgi:hypothetical protein
MVLREARQGHQFDWNVLSTIAIALATIAGVVVATDTRRARIQIYASQVSIHQSVAASLSLMTAELWAMPAPGRSAHPATNHRAEDCDPVHTHKDTVGGTFR